MSNCTLLRNGNLIGLEPLKVEPLDLLVYDGRVVERGSHLEAPESARVIDCRGRFILPGLVNAHSELDYAQTLGLPELPVERSLREILDDSIEAENTVTAAFSYALDAIRCGTTTLIDLHRSPRQVADSLDLTRDTLATAGLRAVVGYGIRGDEDSETRDAGVAENARFGTQNRNDRSAGLFGVEDPEGLDDDAWKKVAELVRERDLGLHLVVGKTESGDQVIDALERAGLVGPRPLIAHGLQLSASVAERVRAAKAWLVHCPTANARLGHAGTPVETWGDCVALGTGGWTSDLFAEARSAYDQARALGSPISPRDAIRLLVGGQQLASELLGLELGSTRRDAGADFVLIDYHPRSPLHSDNIADHLLFGMGARHVDAVMIDGVVCYERGRYPEIDTRRLAPLIRKGAEQLWSAMAAVVEPAGEPAE